MSADEPPDRAFCKRLPKVELHAHLTGSITRLILQQIWDTRAVTEDGFRERVSDPRVALAEDNAGQSIGTFFSHFNTYLYNLISTLPSLISATQGVLTSFADDGVVYLELRTTPRALGGHSPEETITAILNVIEQSSTRSRMVTNLILSVDRAKHSPQQAMEIVNLAVRLKQEGRAVVGVDLCGDPSKPIDITSFRPAFIRARESGLKITLHYAEVPTSSSRTELEEMLEWNPDRLGHVIHVPEDLRHQIKERGIAAELCLSCNVLAGMLPHHSTQTTIADHHFGEWWNDNDTGGEANISLGTDDVGVFGSMSSEEHYLAARHFSLSRSDLVKLSRSAMRGAFCGAETKQKIAEALNDITRGEGLQQ